MPSFSGTSSPHRALSKLSAALILLATACPSGTDATTGGGGEAGSGGEPTGGTGGMPSGGGGMGGAPSGGGGMGGNPDGGGGSGGMGGVGGSGGSGGTGGGMVDPDYPLETEPNGSPSTANPLQDGTLGFTAELSSINDIDVFSFFAPIGSTVSVAITDGMGGCPADATVKLDLYDPMGLELATQTGLCPVLDGTSDPDLATVALEGTYLARVSAAGTPVSSYIVEINVAPPVCGDGITQLGEECDDMNMVPADGCENDCTQTPECGDGTVQTGEECDDGDLMGGDGCDAMCQLEGNLCPEGEPNGSIAMATLLTTCDGGAGAINPSGDQDYYRVNVTQPGSSIRVEVVDVLGVSGTCPSGFDSTVRLYNSAGTELVYDDDDASTGLCSLIHPYPEAGLTPDANAQNLPTGAYYIAVRELGDNGTSPYVVLVDVLPPGCGDGITQMGEECDDANTMSGDGCSAMCETEGNFCNENEGNDSIAAANSLMGCDGAIAQITPVGDPDFFSVEVTTLGSSIRASITNTNGLGCPTGDPTLELYNAAGALLGSDNDDGDALCSLINPVLDSFATNLAPGTYYLRAGENGNNAAFGPYILKASVEPPDCGDLIVQTGEECDDGNANDGDGCDSACLIEGDFCPEVEPNDGFGLATPITAACTGGQGQINYVSDGDWYRFDVGTANSSVRLEIVNVTGSGCPTGFDSNIRIFNSSMTLLAEDNDDGVDLCSLINPGVDAAVASLPVGTYYVRVNENGDNATSAPYVLLVDVNQPGCGDSIVQMGEECDDGNSASGDGCFDCMLEGSYCFEIEPNATQAAGTSLMGCTDGGAGQITPVGDQDFFVFDVPANGSVRVETVSINGTTCPAGTDTLIRLYGPAMTEIGSDDDDGDGNCSLINPASDAFASNLAAGTYAIRVEEFGNNATTPLYLLKVTVQ